MSVQKLCGYILKKKNEFTNWAKKNIKDSQAFHESGNFYRTTDFAIFVHSKLEKILHKKQLIHKKHLVKKIYKENNGIWVSILCNQEKLTSKNIILATGNPVPTWPCHIESKVMKKKGALIENPWTGDWVNKINISHGVSMEMSEQVYKNFFSSFC